MRRTLAGSLTHLAPQTLLRMLSVAAPTGILELLTDAGSLRLEIVAGRVGRPSEKLLGHAGAVLECGHGAFRFEPAELRPLEEEGVELLTFSELARATRRRALSFALEVDVERLLAGEIVELTLPATPNIHVLPEAPLENPLDDLLEDLESAAPGELLQAQVGVVATDPRLWRGPTEADWRRRGWKLRLLSTPSAAPLERLDALVVHHQLAVTRVGHEEEWLGLIARAGALRPAIPVVWVGPLGDGVWVHRLVEAGASFLLPPPQGETGETLHRFLAALTRVVDRQLGLRRERVEPELPAAVGELVDVLLSGADADDAAAHLLRFASAQLARGALLTIGDTVIRCRAGFGYPLPAGSLVLPRGVGLLERVIRSGEASWDLEPDSAGALQLARCLGVERLAPATAVLPLVAGATVVALLVADREGQALPDLRELALIARRLGSLLVGS